MDKKPEKKMCSIHQKKLKIVCTNPPCRKSRFCCTSCLYDETQHSHCITKTVLFDDLASNKFSDHLKNWVEADSDRKRLNEISETIVPNIENNLKLIAKKLDELKLVFIEEIGRFFENLKEKIRENEGLKLFHAHFNIENLKNLLNEKKNDEMHNFFSVTSKEFLRVFDNEQNNKAPTLEKNFINKIFREKTDEIRENFPDFLTTKLQFPDFFPKTPLVPLLKLGNPIHRVTRFKKHEGSIWSYDRKYPDYISFEANKNLRIFGFGMYKTRVITHKWRVLGQIIEGGDSSGKVLQRKDFVVANSLESDEIIGKLLFDPVDLLAGNTLTLYIWVEGPDTLGGLEGNQIVKNDKDKVEFKFFNTKTKETDNGTTVKAGQLPDVYYSVLGE